MFKRDVFGMQSAQTYVDKSFFRCAALARTSSSAHGQKVMAMAVKLASTPFDKGLVDTKACHGLRSSMVIYAQQTVTYQRLKRTREYSMCSEALRTTAQDSFVALPYILSDNLHVL